MLLFSQNKRGKSWCLYGYTPIETIVFVWIFYFINRITLSIIIQGSFEKWDSPLNRVCTQHVLMTLTDNAKFPQYGPPFTYVLCVLHQINLCQCERWGVRDGEHVLNHIICASGLSRQHSCSFSGWHLVNTDVSPHLLLTVNVPSSPQTKYLKQHDHIINKEKTSTKPNLHLNLISPFICTYGSKRLQQDKHSGILK